jgi:hypothetical protein
MKCRLPDNMDKNEKLRLEMRDSMRKKYKDNNIIFAENLPIKVSDLVFKLITPFITTYEDTDWETCIPMGIIAWNLASMPQKRYDECYNKIFIEMKKNTNDIEPYKTDLDFLIERKRKYFNQYKVIITDYKLTYNNRKPYLLVSSQFINSEVE